MGSRLRRSASGMNLMVLPWPSAKAAGAITAMPSDAASTQRNSPRDLPFMAFLPFIAARCPPRLEPDASAPYARREGATRRGWVVKREMFGDSTLLLGDRRLDPIPAVILAKAGIHHHAALWMPAPAGMAKQGRAA